MTTKMEKKMIGAFYTLTEEKAKWEKDLIASNHRNLDLQYIVDEQDEQIATLKAALVKRYTDDGWLSVATQNSTLAEVREKAISRLRSELPEIGWEDMK
jgi:hypothetical protein